MLSGTAVRVDSTPNDMQVDLSPCQHLSLPPQSLIQRQPNSVWEYCVLCRQLHTHKPTLPLYLSSVLLFIDLFNSSVFHPHPVSILTGHLYFRAPLQKGSDPIPHDAAVEAGMGAIQRRD